MKALIGERNLLRILWHRSRAFVAAARYGFPARKLTVIGITGTDGKTTTVGMITHILRKNEKRVGSASTAFMQINDQREENATHLTTVSPFTLQRFLRRLVREGCEFAVIEMSSHGLVQGRCSFTFPKVAAITNTAMEHLDYHGSMEQYRHDKAIMFRMLRVTGMKVLNTRDETYGIYNALPSARTLRYARTPRQGVVRGQHENFWASDITVTDHTIRVILHCDSEDADRKSVNVLLPMTGVFNVDNALCAIAACYACGIPFSSCVGALSDFKPIPGRMEKIDEGQAFSVYIDFAVSPQAYEQALRTLRDITGDAHRVHVLCSCCGNRMRGKRPEIGRICSKFADVVVATEDETYGEDPHAALEEMWVGVDQSSCEAHKIFDRREAITFLLRNALPGDAVVLCGMGPFSTFTKLEGRIAWDEREVAREILRTL